MDVGCWLLKTTSANLLKNCVSNLWGLLYSDGASVFLLPISSVDDQSYLLPKVQKLENVGLIHDIACSPGYQDGYFIAAITSSEAGIKVSVWRAREEEIGEPFSQSIDAFICGNPLPQGQGLSWHPFSNVLCTVCQNEAFVFNNDAKNGVLEKIKSFSGSERFMSCCWNYSGSLLIFATHSKLLFYNFTCDPDPCEPVFSFVIGKVCSLESVDQTRLLCAIELPISDVVRHQVESSTHDSVEAPNAISNSLVGNSQLLLIGYNAVDGKPYIMAKMDIEEILTPNIMVYEEINKLCIVASRCSSRIHFFSIDKLPITKITEMVLENGKVPKGIAISTFSNTKLLWLLSGQTCEDCTASLSIPDDGYISCNMTFRVIALQQLLGPEKRFIVQEKDFASCFDRRSTPKSRHCSNHHLRLPEKLTPSLLPEIDTLLKAPTTARRDFCEKAVEVRPEDLDADDKSVLSYYSAPDHHMPRRTTAGKTYEASNSLSHEDYYSMDRSNYSRGSTLRGQTADRKIFDIERCVLEMFETHSSELSSIKSELKDMKKVLSNISSQQPSSTPTSAQLLIHVQELQHSIHLVENKLDVMTIDMNARMRHQDRKLSEIRKELSALKRV